MVTGGLEMTSSPFRIFSGVFAAGVALISAWNLGDATFWSSSASGDIPRIMQKLQQARELARSECGVGGTERRVGCLLRLSGGFPEEGYASNAVRKAYWEFGVRVIEEDRMARLRGVATDGGGAGTMPVGQALTAEDRLDLMEWNAAMARRLLEPWQPSWWRLSYVRHLDRAKNAELIREIRARSKEHQERLLGNREVAVSTADEAGMTGSKRLKTLVTELQELEPALTEASD
jgi:hypothetical protein